MSEWTKGPWEVHPYHTGGKLRICIVQKGGVLKRILIDPPNWFFDTDVGCEEHVEFVANMTLISAAPDLVEALTDARERMVGISPGMKALIAKTDAALAKARGETT